VRDKEREQASKITAWVSEAPGGARTLWIANRSDAEVYMLSIKPFETNPVEFAELAPGMSKKRTMAPYNGVVRSWTVDVSVPGGGIPLLDSHIRVHLQRIAKVPAPEMIFRDAAGRWWRRDGRGILRKSRPRQRLFTSFGLYMFDVNIALLYFDSETRRWRIGRDPDGPSGGIGQLLNRAISRYERWLDQLRKRRRPSQKSVSSGRPKEDDN
jgi:hypothetical protein